MEQETLEEAAERFRNNNPGTMQGGNNIKILNAFIAGAKYQVEKSYSKEDLLEAFKASRTVKNYKGEWEETYSDEMTSSKYENFKEWFEQFKKK
jgi:hypothetical protein